MIMKCKLKLLPRNFDFLVYGMKLTQPIYNAIRNGKESFPLLNTRLIYI